MRNHPLTERKRGTSCKLCGKCSDSETDLIIHEITVHPNVGSPRRHETAQPNKKNDTPA